MSQPIFSSQGYRRRNFKRKATGLRSAFARNRAKRPRLTFQYPARRSFARVGTELKYFDSSQSFVVPEATAWASTEADPTTLLCLNGVAQGDLMNERNGSKINMKSIEITGIVDFPVQSDVSAPFNGTVVNIALVLDTQTNGAQLNGEDVYVNTRTGTDTYLTATPLRNMSYTERFKVLKTKTIMHIPGSIGRDGALAADPILTYVSGKRYPFKMFVDLKDLPVKWKTDATTGVIGGIIDNSLHLLCNATGNENDPRLVYQARLRFYG